MSSLDNSSDHHVPNIGPIILASMETSAVHDSPPQNDILRTNNEHDPYEPDLRLDIPNNEAPLPLSTATHFRYDVFPANVSKPILWAPVPKMPRAQIQSTLQLVFCASLMLEDVESAASDDRTSHLSTLGEGERNWLTAIQEHPNGKARVRWMLSTMVKVFVKETCRSPAAIAEVVILGPVLCRSDYRILLSSFIDTLGESTTLDVELLHGMVQLIQNASPGFLVDDDMVKILRILRKRLVETHTSSSGHVYQLVYALSKVFDVMMSGMVQDLNRNRDYHPLFDVLRDLRGVDHDDFLRFQINYAYQTLLYLPDDETPLQAIFRYTESLAIGVSAVASVFKLDPMNALAAVEYLQQTADNANDVLKANLDGTRTILATGEGAVQGFEKAYHSGERRAWFLALQAVYSFVRDGRLVAFNRLVCDAACRLDRDFQRGVCQVLGEIAVDPHWDVVNRQRAINFLGEIHKNNTEQKKWIVSILRQIIKVEDVEDHARALLTVMLREGCVEMNYHHPLSTRLPLPTSSTLFKLVLDIPFIECDLDKLRLQRLAEHDQPIFISPQAKKNIMASDEESFPLEEKVRDFLESDREVFLVLGDSGSGKSTFCRHLEHELWTNYQAGDKIPLSIDLPSTDRPEHDMVAKQLRSYDFSDTEILHLKRDRQFVLICDGYDESRLITNLHTSNRLNQPRQWNVKMIISCRNTYLHHDYQGRFRPQGADRYSGSRQDQFEEAIIIPFSQDDVRSYVEHHVRVVLALGTLDQEPAPTVDDYLGRLSIIPDMLDLVKNPFLLTLALKTLPFVSIDIGSPSVIETLRLQLFDKFIKQWIRISKERLEQTNLSQVTHSVFEQLLEADFGWCVIDYLKRLAASIYRHQKGQPIVEYIHLKDNKTWRAEFFGLEIKPTLLREASPLSRAGIRHWFLHQSLLEYFRALAFYDPFDSDEGDDDDDSDDGSDDGDGKDSVGAKDDSHGGGDGSVGGGDNSQGNGGGSHGGEDNSTQGGHDSSEGSHGSTGGSDDPSNNGNGSPGNNQGPPDHNDGSQERKNGVKDGSQRNKDDSRSKEKNTLKKRVRSSDTSNQLAQMNLFNEPAVLQFLVDRARSDKRLKERLLATIERSKSDTLPSLAAANAITILVISGQQLEDIDMRGIRIPQDYLAEGGFKSARSTQSNSTGVGLI
ncbi:Transducin (beta)-like 1 X-linked receptor 1 [Mortierella sp. NVP41]|nr:Transducin (beta)-like 1 X-linked receptor 1 [Mortierella sp. NVP41]